MLFDKTNEDLKNMLPAFQRIEYELAEKESCPEYESPVVIFAVGANGQAVMIDNPNSDKLGHGVEDMLQEEFDNLEFNKPPGVYSAQFTWFSPRDEYTGEYDCELVVNGMVKIWEYKKGITNEQT